MEARRSRYVLLFLLVLALALGLQVSGSAYSGWNPYNADEASHLVTGMMVRQYFLETLSGNLDAAMAPMSYAQQYYLHYPKVALGHWPPVFYVIQAAWGLPFPATRESVLVLLAMLQALTAVVAFRLARSAMGTGLAWTSAIAVGLLPGVVIFARDIMTEIPQALLMAIAMTCFVRFMNTGAGGAAIGFGLTAAAALLAKGTGLALAPIPVLAVILARRWDLPKRVMFWLPAPLVILLAGPWYLFAPSALHERAVPLGGPGIAAWRISVPPFTWFSEFGWPVSILAAIGLAVILWRFVRRTPVDSVWAVSAAMVLSGTAFPMLFAVWETRHQIEMAVPMVLCAGLGAQSIGFFLTKFLPIPAGIRSNGEIDAPDRMGWAVLAIASIVGVAGSLQSMRTDAGYAQVAQAIHEVPVDEMNLILVAGSGMGEGALIAELAQREPVPQRYMVRSTKWLETLSWMGSTLELGSLTPEESLRETAAALDRLPFQMIVMDPVSPPPFDYFGELERVIANHPEQWSPLPVAGAGGLLVYVRKGVAAESLSDAEIQTRLREAMGSLDL